ncbi:early nodulin 93 protein [Klebsormidium nitens]|uniref:Early nodulin 93 protein n=1 Tax=Klebsormidium nitens TaxID=105231 RepID=A0A1Y1I2A5_KLENI|nr:early nodulin 93 protein [Klebsormidium nitens]|eukprot:GAQ83569.1 early nodulin 93 protein [Klebsormidium nitens]
MGLWSEFLERQEAARSAGTHAATLQRSGQFIPQVVERNGLSEAEEKKQRVKQCTDAGVYKGLEAAALWGGLALAGTLAAVRFSPWFAHNFNYTGRALIPCAGMVGAYFVVSEKTILECTRRTSKEANDAGRRARALQQQ